MTDLDSTSAGAQWLCVDLHLHTPGVHSFRLDGGGNYESTDRRTAIAGAYVDALADAGVDLGVVTDYQGIRQDWFDVIRDVAAARGILILPGAELSVGQGAGKGLHLLLICSADTPGAKITEAIRHCSNSPDALFEGRLEHKDLDLRDPLADTLRQLRDNLDCVIVAAHANEKNGIFKSLGPMATATLIHDGLIDAIDHYPAAKQSLQGTAVLSPDQLDSLALTESSDPKSIPEVSGKVTSEGHRRLTWLKLSSYSSSAIRLALHDPRTRVLTRPPRRPQHARILSMTVDGGFLSGLDINFNDDLTTLIGGRGAGKSAILETLRYGLEGRPFSDAEERASLVHHALGSGGQVKLRVERPGAERQQYEVSRVWGQAPRVTDLSTGAVVNVRPMDLFGGGCSPVILLQREIQEVARDEMFRRRLLDEIIGDDARKADEQVLETVKALKVNAENLQRIDEELARGEEKQERLQRLEVEIGFFETQGVAKKLQRNSRASADLSRVVSSRSEVENVAQDVRNFDALSARLLRVETLLRESESEHAERLISIAPDVRAAAEGINEFQNELSASLDKVTQSLGTLQEAWPSLIVELTEELRLVQEQLKTDKLDAQVYLDAVTEKTTLSPQVDRLGETKRVRSRLVRERAQTCGQLQDRRRQAFALRLKTANNVNTQLTGRLRMDVKYLADSEAFRSELVSLLKGSRVTSDAVDSILARDGIDGIELRGILRRGASEVASELKVSPANASRLIAWLHADSERSMALEVLAPNDSVSLALVVDGQPRDLAKLSGGQKATSLLLLLFAQSGRPLILDQPEDDLDNRFVYEDVVGLIREEKGVSDPERRRQIIAATHNANIPVNGDAELVVSLAETPEGCHVRCRASIDDDLVREEIRAVLEGGEEAFRRRAEKYGGILRFGDKIA